MSRFYRLTLCLVVSLMWVIPASHAYAQDVDSESELTQTVYLPLVVSQPQSNIESDLDGPPVGIAGGPVISSVIVEKTSTETIYVPVDGIQGSSVLEARVAEIRSYGVVDTVIRDKPDTMEDVEASAVNTVDVTLSRSVEIDGYDEFNHYARAAAQTETSDCVDRLYTEAKHEYRGTDGTVYNGGTNGGQSLAWCHDSQTRKTFWVFSADGTYHTPISRHAVKEGGGWTTYYGPGGNGIRGTEVRGS